MKDTRTLYATVPAELHKRLKILAIHQGRDLREVVREAIEQYIERVPASH